MADKKSTRETLEDELGATEPGVEEVLAKDEDSLSDLEESGEETSLARPEGTQWYVVHSYSGYENKVQKNLLHRTESMAMQDKIFQVVVPTEEEVELNGSVFGS